jgi:nanoRNase/pAp phosphatase (c-di-AMP/oligoRNAs hydrolase)
VCGLAHGCERTNVSIRVSGVKDHDRVSLQVAQNIFNRTCRTDVGALMASHGGGGHRGTGTCQIATGEADRLLAELIAAVKEA